MKTVEIGVYQFDELSESAKEKAREWYRSGGFDYPWHEYTIDEFITENQSKFYDINAFFSGFWSQGDGACFEYSNISQDYFWQIIEGLNLPNWKKRIIEQCDFSAKGKHTGHYYHENSISHYFTLEARFNWSYKNATDFVSEIESLVSDQIEQDAKELSRELYKTLEKEWEYLNSDESVDESILANEYEFTEDGNRY